MFLGKNPPKVIRGLPDFNGAVLAEKGCSCCSPTTFLAQYCIAGSVRAARAAWAVVPQRSASQNSSVTLCAVLVSCCLQSVTDQRRAEVQ